MTNLALWLAFGNETILIARPACLINSTGGAVDKDGNKNGGELDEAQQRRVRSRKRRGKAQQAQQRSSGATLKAAYLYSPDRTTFDIL